MFERVNKNEHELKKTVPVSSYIYTYFMFLQKNYQIHLHLIIAKRKPIQDFNYEMTLFQ